MSRWQRPDRGPVIQRSCNAWFSQCLVLNPNVPNHIEMARILIDAGAELTGPLVVGHR